MFIIGQIVKALLILVAELAILSGIWVVYFSLIKRI